MPGRHSALHVSGSGELTWVTDSLYDHWLCVVETVPATVGIVDFTFPRRLVNCGWIAGTILMDDVTEAFDTRAVFDMQYVNFEQQVYPWPPQNQALGGIRWWFASGVVASIWVA